MKYRDVERALLANKCTWKPGKGDHIKWYCPCGKHIAVVTQARNVSAGVVADTIAKLAPGGLASVIVPAGTQRLPQGKGKEEVSPGEAQ